MTAVIPNTPTEADWIANFVRGQMGITSIYLPDGSPFFDWAYAVASAIVNLDMQMTPAPIYTLAVYNLAGSNLINYAQDQSGQTYFASLRSQFNIGAFVPGVVSSAGDVSTSAGLVVPDWAQNLQISDLQLLKDPYGRQYLALAQKYGPTIWDLS
jgi:hypothetical protein